MLSDFDMIVKHFPERDDIIIYPIADVHLGAAEHMKKEWETFCKELLKQPNAYIILGGDLINNATKSSVSNVYEEVLRPREQKRLITEMLAPLKDRILCAVGGNHERRSAKDVDNDITYDIMAKLDLEDVYRENIAFLKIQMGNIKNDGRKNPTYSIAITHGSGGGLMTGSTVNRAERFGYVFDGQLDCLIVGHSHKPFVTQPQKIHIDTQHNRVSYKPFKVVCATSWLEYGGYAVQKMLLPSGHALQTITLHGNKKQIDVMM